MGQRHLFQKLRLLDHPGPRNLFFQTKHWHVRTIVHPNIHICLISKWSMYNWWQWQCVIERVSCGEAEMILLSVLPVRVNYCNKQTAWQLGIFIFSSQQRVTLSFRHECQTQKYLRNISGWPCLPTTVLIPHQNISNLFWTVDFSDLFEARVTNTPRKDWKVWLKTIYFINIIP